MENFQLYKRRDFSTYLSDTVLFFRLHWKNYLANYAIITGGLFVALIVVYYFLIRDFFGAIALLGVPGAHTDVSSILGENAAWLVTLLIIGLILGILFSLLCSLYPVAYLQLKNKSEKPLFSASELFAQMKSQLGRVIAFGLLSMVTFFPVMIVFVALSAMLIIFLIGIPLLIILAPAFILWYTESFYAYLNENLSYFSSLKVGWNIMLSKFWHMWGATISIYLLMQIVTGIVTFVPIIIMIVTQLNSGNVDNIANIQKTAMPIIYTVNYFLSYLLMNFMLIAHGIMYYSYKEQTAHVQSYSEIQSIGQNAL